MAAILAVTRRGKVLATVRAAGWPGIVSGAMFCTMFTCFMLAITRTTVANTLVVNSLFPVFAAILGAVVLRAGDPGLHVGRHRAWPSPEWPGCSPTDSARACRAR